MTQSPPTGELVARLERAITTASNDDYSEAGSDKRQRHVERIVTMCDVRDALTASRAEVERLKAELRQAREALRPFAEYAPYVEMFVEGRAKFGGSPILPTKHFRKSHFDAARAALQVEESKG